MKNDKKRELATLVKTMLIIFLIFNISNVKAQCWIAVDTGFSHTLAIRNDGTLWSWGQSASGSQVYGALGENIANRCIPKQVGTDTDWVSISAGNHYSLAIKANGTLWACGSNQGYGSTGFSTMADTYILTQVGTSTNWKSVSAGNFLAMGIKTDGTLWQWSSYSGTIIGGNIFNGIPQRVPTQVDSATDWKVISCGDNYALAIKNNNTLWARGYNPYGQLGNGTTITNTTFIQIGIGSDWKTISAGENSSLGIKLDGSLWAWGRNNLGQLGDGTILNKLIPTRIGLANDWTKITACSYHHSFAIKTNGTLWGWGNNSQAYLGDGTMINKVVPTQIGTDTNWTSISSENYTIGLKNDNTLWGCGSNFFIGLGLPNGTVASNTLLNLTYQKIICSNPIVANNDIGSSIFGITSTAINNVLLNDIYYYNSANTSNVKITFISSTNSGITLNTATGSINVSNTVPIGNYTLTYYIHDINLNPTYVSITCGCGSYGVVNISVKPSIDAVNDDFSSIPINNATGGLTTTSVTSNDLLNGVAVNNSDITISLVNNGGLTGASINNAGILSIPAGFLSNIYTLTYSICQNSNPTNCDTAIVYIAISDPFIQTPNIVFAPRANNTVNLVEIQNDSKILIGGIFDKYNYINSFKIARLNSDLTLDTSFLSSGPIPTDKNARDMKIQADGKVILVGSFDSFNGGTNGRGIVRLNTNGTVDTSFNVGGTGIPNGTNQFINACAIQADGKILLGGGYIDSYNGLSTRNLIRINSNGSLDPTFSYPYIVNRSTISKIVLQADGKILVGGVYKVGTIIDPGQPSVFRLNTDGSLDTTFTTAATGVNVFATNCTSCLSAIQNIIPLQTGKILIVGVFNTYNGNPYKNIVRLNLDGSVDTTFNPTISTNRVIKDVAIEANGKMVIAGEFSTFNGNTVDKIIRLNVNGSIDSSFSSGTGLYDDQSNGSNIFNNIQVLKRQNDGKIIVGGRFTAYNFIGANCITRITPSIAGGQAKGGLEYYDSEPQVEQNDILNQIKIFPNPSNGNFYINLGDENSNSSIEIFSILGQKVFEKRDIATSAISISNISPGIYLVKLNKNDTIITQKIIVN